MESDREDPVARDTPRGWQADRPELERGQGLPPPGKAPTPAEDRLTSEIMGVESPDGAPPLKHERQLSSIALVGAFVVVVIGTIVILVIGGIASFGMGLVLAAVLLAAAFPVWVAALLRRGERHHAEEESEAVLRNWRRYGKTR